MSLRWRLLIWHALILVTVLIVFGVTVYYLQRQSRRQQIDAALDRTADRVVSGLRRPFRRPPSSGRDAGDDESLSAAEQRRDSDDSDRDTDVGDDNSQDRDRPGRSRWWRAIQFEMPDDARQLFEGEESSAYYFLIWRYNGELLAKSDYAPDIPMPDISWDENPWPSRTIRQRGDLREIVFRSRYRHTVVVGRPTVHDRAALQQFAFLLGATGVGVLMAGLIGGYWLSSRAVRPIEVISATAEAISADNLDQRIDIGGADSELAWLAAVLNSSFDRLQTAFEQQVQLTADASHELRTPLAVLLSNAELALSKPRSADEYREALATCLRAAQRMRSLITNLLTLARMESGELALQKQRFDLSEKVRECVDLVRPLAERRGIRIESEVPSILIDADPQQISHMLTNLLTNAIHYNKDRGRIDLEATSKNGAATLRISDTGIGIPPEDLPHVFDRFYRVDKSRTRAEGGSGLGLSICQTIVAAHGGRITATSNGRNGTTFEVTLPPADAVEL